MPTSAWKTLTAGVPWFHGEGSYPIQAYSEFLPAPRPACWAYRPDDTPPRVGNCGWRISAFEEGLELRPGLEHIGTHLIKALVKLAQGKSGHGISRHKQTDNPYWPEELAQRAGHLPHERYVMLSPLALSRTLDDKGRVRWTLFGGSEQGPGTPFWKSFYSAPEKPVNPEAALDFMRRLLQTAYGMPAVQLTDLGKAGFRILPNSAPLAPHWKEGPLPGWTKPYLWRKGQPLRGVKYLLTFMPFASLPEPVRKAYLAGDLHLLPFPGSLLFWGVQTLHCLAENLPLARQVALLHMVPRHEGFPGLRVPQSGWLHEPHPDVPENQDRFGPVISTYKRSHRWEKVHRYEDELATGAREDKLTRVLFSTAPHDLGLYGKPMGRNVQLWTSDFRMLLDGPHSRPQDLTFAAQALGHGGLFGYRFLFPAMRVGLHEIYWHRPLVACLHAATNQPIVLHDAPHGYLTAYRADKPDPARPVELWPHLDNDPYRMATLAVLDDSKHEYHPRETILNLRKLHETHHLRGEKPLPRSFARQLLTLPRKSTLEDWLKRLPQRVANHHVEAVLEAGVHSYLEPAAAPPPDEPLPSLTYDQTANRSFEVAYWKTIASLATDRFVNKDNADCVRDPITQSLLSHHARDLEKLGDYLLDYYRDLIRSKGLEGKALAGEIPFQWRTDFDFSWMGGWLANQLGNAYERNLLVVIPGRDRRRAVIMGDHYDTAYMLDRYDHAYGGTGARLSAAGADDNHSATTALMLGAPIFMEMSKAGQLGCDVWLIHLTGEEFPSDCLGARALTQRVVEGTLAIHLPDNKRRDLSKTRVQGVYVMDMIAHNNDKAPDIFQIAPGTGAESMWLAFQAHQANQIWNTNVSFWNQKPARRGKGRGKRSPNPRVVPSTAAHLALSGEVRPPYDPRSTLYNTDGQIFSDAGVPVVLFMENYDINRTGYHDTHDTMENIDLDYGSALAAITIESVARAATLKPDV